MFHDFQPPPEKYIPENLRPLNLPYPWSWFLEAIAAHPVIFMLSWIIPTAVLLGVYVYP